MRKQLLSIALLAFFSSVHADQIALPDKVTFGVQMEINNVSDARKWLDAGLNPDFEGDRIGTGLMIGAWNDNIEVMELFLSHGANINALNRNGESALLMATWKNSRKAYEWLISKGANVNPPAPLHWSALHYAAFNGHLDLVQDLLKRGANINQTSPNASTPLMMASREGHENVAKLLMKEGANKTLKNDWDMTAMTFALRNQNLRIASALADSPEQAQNIEKTDVSTLPKVVKSEPLPKKLEDIMKMTRQAQAEGLPTVHLRQAFLDALGELSKGKPISSSQVAEGSIKVVSDRKTGREKIILENRFNK